MLGKIIFILFVVGTIFLVADCRDDNCILTGAATFMEDAASDIKDTASDTVAKVTSTNKLIGTCITHVGDFFYDEGDSAIWDLTVEITNDKIYMRGVGKYHVFGYSIVEEKGDLIIINVNEFETGKQYTKELTILGDYDGVILGEGWEDIPCWYE